MLLLVRVRHDYPVPKWYEAEHLFATPSGLAYDFAILLVNDLHSESSWTDELCKANYMPGIMCLCISI